MGKRVLQTWCAWMADAHAGAMMEHRAVPAVFAARCINVLLFVVTGYRADPGKCASMGCAHRSAMGPRSVHRELYARVVAVWQRVTVWMHADLVQRVKAGFAYQAAG